MRSRSILGENRIYYVLFIVMILFGVLFVVPQQVHAERGITPSPSVDEVNAIAKKIYCPVCENTPLDVCTTKACAQWRDLIRQKLAAGWNEEQIIDYFVAQYGDHVLVEPPGQGFKQPVYLVPFVLIMIAFVIMVLSFKSKQDASSKSSQYVMILDGDEDEYVDRFERELSRRN